MKKIFIVLAFAAACVACGHKTAETAETVVVEDTVETVVAENVDTVVAE